MTIIVTIFYACVAGVFLDINDSRDISLLAVFHFSVYFRRKLYISDAKYEHFSVPAMFQKQHFRGKKLHKNEITLKDTSIIQAYSIYIYFPLLLQDLVTIIIHTPFLQEQYLQFIECVRIYLDMTNDTFYKSKSFEA